MDKEKIPQESCTHAFEISRIVDEVASLYGTNMERVAYVVCIKCGIVKRKVIDLPHDH